MFALLSVGSVVTGAVLAWASDRHIAHRELLETCAGLSLFAGLGLLGALLPRLS